MSKHIRWSAHAMVTFLITILEGLHKPLILNGNSGGEGGIRTLGSALRHYDGLANRCFRPLSHLSG
jgi:hypothetical protein